jgi:hypothetical protein
MFLESLARLGAMVGSHHYHPAHKYISILNIGLLQEHP